MEDAIVMEIEIAAPPERVFRALTDPRQVLAWWSEDGKYRTTKWELDPRVGGKWRTTGIDGAGAEWVGSGEVVEWDPPWVLAHTWEFDRHAAQGFPKTTVRYELERAGQGTRLRLTHQGFAGHRAALDDYRGGWPGALALLRAYTEAQAA